MQVSSGSPDANRRHAGRRPKLLRQHRPAL